LRRAVTQTLQAAFAAVHAALGDRPKLLDNAGALVSALPPETPLFLDDPARIALSERPGDGWVSAVAATMTICAQRPVTPVRDNVGREHNVVAPELQLGTWLLPDPDAPVPAPAQSQAREYYARLLSVHDGGDRRVNPPGDRPAG
jgi:hypothetical protein